MDKLHIIAEVLMLKEKIDGKDFEALMNGSVTKDEFLGTVADTEETAEETEATESGAENE